MTPTLHARARATLTNDRGSLIPWFLITTGMLAFLVGLAVDASGQIRTRQHAYMVAAEAARTGGQEVAVTTGMDGDSAAVDPLAAAAAARDYLAAAGVTGTVTITTGGTMLEVTTETEYDPRFLGTFGVGPLHVGGHAQTRLVRVMNGAEQ